MALSGVGGHAFNNRMHTRCLRQWVGPAAWRASGFTLVELLATIAVAAALASLALPAFSRQVALSQRIALTNTLVGQIQMARAEAIKLGREVVMCASDDGQQCRDDWSAGYLIFMDDPRGPPYQLTDGRFRLRAQRWHAPMHVAVNRDQFVFRPLARRSTNGTFRICHPQGRVPPRAVIVAPTGRPRVSARLPDGREIPCPAG